MSDASTGGISRQWQRVNSNGDLSSLGGNVQSVNEHPDHSYLASPSFANSERILLGKSKKLMEESSRRGNPASSSHRDEYRSDRRGHAHEYTSTYTESPSSPRRGGSGSRGSRGGGGGGGDVSSGLRRDGRREAPALTAQNSCREFVRTNGGGSGSGGYELADIPPDSYPMADPLFRTASGVGSRGLYSSTDRTGQSRPGAYASTKNSFDEVSAKLAQYECYSQQREQEQHEQHHLASPRRTPSPHRPAYQQGTYDSYSPQHSSQQHHRPSQHHNNNRDYSYEEQHQQSPYSGRHGSRGGGRERGGEYDYSPPQFRRLESQGGDRRYSNDAASYSPPPPPLRRQETRGAQTIEIAPGVHAKLRGAQETWECVERDFYTPVCCIACTLDLCCIQDADYVLCPMCRVVSPMEGLSEDSGDYHNGGVGLGFTFEDLQRWQMEILQKRNNNHNGL